MINNLDNEELYADDSDTESSLSSIGAGDKIVRYKETDSEDELMTIVESDESVVIGIATDGTRMSGFAGLLMYLCFLFVLVFNCF